MSDEPLPLPIGIFKNRSRALLPSFIVAAGCLGMVPAHAQGTAWLAEPGTGYLSLSYVGQSADEFYAGTTKMPTPLNADLQQSTVWMSANYFLSDAVAVDFRTGWAESQFVTGEGIPTSSASFSGRVDTDIGITWRLSDEWITGLPSIALRGAAIVAGDYEPGHINSIGDGGDGYELSLIVAKFLGSALGLSAEVGQRWRNDDIPTNTFLNLTGIWLVNDKLSLGVDYSIVDTESSLDIAGPGFSPPRFPQVQEEWKSVGGRLFYDVSEELSVTLFYVNKFTGRNTPLSGAYGATISYTFGNR